MKKTNVSKLKGTGLLMRLLEMEGDKYSIDEVIIAPGLKANWLRFPGTRVEHRARKPGGKVEVAGKVRPFALPTKRAKVLEKGEWHRLTNPTSSPLTAKVTLKPAWNPKRAHFRIGEKEYRGDQVWFEVKTYLGDKSDRAKYQLHKLSAKRGEVSVLLKPGAKSLEAFHKTAKVVVTGIEGSGLLYLDGKAHPIREKVKVTVKPGQRYRLENNKRRPFMVKQVHTKQWEPNDTFYIYGDRVIPGDEVWFEFVVAD